MLGSGWVRLPRPGRFFWPLIFDFGLYFEFQFGGWVSRLTPSTLNQGFKWAFPNRKMEMVHWAGRAKGFVVEAMSASLCLDRETVEPRMNTGAKWADKNVRPTGKPVNGRDFDGHETLATK